MLILLLFGATNGYVSSMCMMAAPSLTHNLRLKGRAEDVDVAATVASFCLVGGLAICVTVSPDVDPRRPNTLIVALP